MEEKRKGRQTPTTSHILPYTKSHGGEAVKMYNKSDRTAMEWQELMLEDIMAVNDDDLWIHMKFGYSLPRRNGKSELLIARILWGVAHGEKVLYTAHRVATSSSVYFRVIQCMSKCGYVEKEDYKTIKTAGFEHIEMLGGRTGMVNFRTRSTRGGLGEGYDLLVIDEAQEYTSDQETALKYVVTDSKNPQTLMCGTPPTVVSAGTVFQDFRKAVLTGNGGDDGWAEWSVPRMSDTKDIDLLYETNPSLGLVLTERNIKSELGKDPTDDNIQRFGLWLQYNQKSAISEEEWNACKLPEPPVLLNSYYFAVRFEAATGNVSLAVAAKTTDEKIFVEAIDCRPIREGNAWIMRFLHSSRAKQVIIDGKADRELLNEEMRSAKIKCKKTSLAELDVLKAHAHFEKELFGGGICHMGQPSLTQIVSNCDKHTYGTGGFVYTSLLEGVDVSLLKAVVLAHWAASTASEKKKPSVRY